MAYVAPSPSDLTERYPAFASVNETTIAYWLADAAEECADWPEDVRARAEMAYAAHRMAELGLGKGVIPAGATSFRSGDFSASISEVAAARIGFDATAYGREFAMLRRRYFAGPRPAWTSPCV